MRCEAGVAPLYLRKVRGPEGIDGQYFGIGSVRVFSGCRYNAASLAHVTAMIAAGCCSADREAIFQGYRKAALDDDDK
jgi:hypothetical protein